MKTINNLEIVKGQYTTADNLNRRISIHQKYSTNKMGFGNWIFSNYDMIPNIEILELGCGNGEILKPYFTNVKRLDYNDSLDITNIDDLLDYIYSLEGMSSITNLERNTVKKILQGKMVNGVLNIPKEYGMFICKK